MIVQPPSGADLVSHVVFDPDSGSILGTLRHDPVEPEGHDAAGQRAGDAAEQVAGDAAGQVHDHGGCGCEHDTELLASFRHAGAGSDSLPALTALPADAPQRLDRMRVDPTSKLLRPLPQLVIDPERAVLDGDGEDTVTIEIRAVDEHGAVMAEVSGEVHVQTGRGKLSERGGTVRLEGGRGRIQLTSVRETVDAVPLVATMPAGTAVPATTSLAFA